MKKKNKKNLIMFLPSIEGGGVEKNFFLISNFLVKKVNRVFLITISKNYKKKFNKSIKFITLSSNIWDKFGRGFKYFLAIILLIKEILKNKNAIVFSFQANVYCILICKLFGVKIISRSNSAKYSFMKSRLKRMIFGIFLNLADVIVVNSNQLKIELKKKLNVNAICIYNPLNVTEIIKKSKIKSKKIFISNKELKILNIGRYTDQKDQITLLRSLNNLKKKINFQAVLIGKGILKSKLREYINDNDLNKKVKLMNFIENPYNLMRQTDVFILSSKYEGLPNVLLEALVLKKFIISSNCPTGPREILLNGKGGLLFKTGDHKGLSKKIIYFLHNRSKCKKLLKRATKNLHRFDFNGNLEKYFNIIKSI